MQDVCPKYLTTASNTVLWGNQIKSFTFYGACDMVAIDNDYLQLLVRTRTGTSGTLYDFCLRNHAFYNILTW